MGEAYGAGVDVWSYGCTLAELATGRPLFPGSSTVDQLWRIARCVGPLTPDHIAQMGSNPRLAGLAAALQAGQGRYRTLRQRLPVSGRCRDSRAECRVHAGPVLAELGMLGPEVFLHAGRLRYRV